MSTPPLALARSLRTIDVVMLTIGGVIGSGIFLTPGAVLAAAGKSPLLALSTWVIGGVLALFGALTYSELGARRPDAGGIYVFIREGFGRGPAFLFGLSVFIAGGGGVVAALVVAFGDTAQAGLLGTTTPKVTQRSWRDIWGFDESNSLSY
jgi:basic amino acid/polyamine antiporter, APA family